MVTELNAQLLKESIPSEIRCYDDGSDQQFKNKNSRLNGIVIYKELQKNIGRSAIRNLLAQESEGEFLVFLDCDSGIISPDFIKEYLKFCTKADVILGGTIYPRHMPSKNVSLRWKYGREREMRTATSRNVSPYEGLNLNNILIKKDIFLQYKLDETISTYGHEDTLFGYRLKENNVAIIHIDNAVDHLGLEPNNAFMEKSKVAVRNFYKICSKGNYGRETKLYKAFETLKKWNLIYMFSRMYSMFEKMIEQNLTSEDPSLMLFDCYKLNEFIKASLKK